MATPTRFPKGVTTAEKTSTLGNFGLPDPTGWHTYFEDFDTYTAADWTITATEAGSGSASQALGDFDGGALVITNDDADNDAVFFNKVGESFRLLSGKKAAFKARFRVTDETQSDFVIGLQITDTSPLDVTDGVFFQKDDGDALLDFHVEKDGTASSATGIHTMGTTWTVVGWAYNGKTGDAGEITYFVNDVAIGSLPVTNIPDDEELTVSFGIQNGEADAKTMRLDYIFAARER